MSKIQIGAIIVIISFTSFLTSIFYVVFSIIFQKQFFKKINRILNNHNHKINEILKKEVVIEEVNEKITFTNEWKKNQKIIKNTNQFLEIKKLIRIADVALSRGDISNAEKYLVEALALENNNVDINKKLGKIYILKDQFVKAESIYTNLIESGFQDAEIFTNLAIALYNQNQKKLALKSYLKAIELEPDKSDKYASIGQIYIEFLELENARDAFFEAVKRESKNIDYLLTLSRILVKLDEIDTAVKYLNKILDIEPYNMEAKKILSKL